MATPRLLVLVAVATSSEFGNGCARRRPAARATIDRFVAVETLVMRISTARCRSLSVVAFVSTVTVAAAAAPVEPQWFAAAQAAQPALIASLKEMVAIESGSANATGLAQMADYVERRLRELGARTERIAAVRPQGT